MSIEGTEIDILNAEKLAPLVNHLQALSNEFELLSLYEEFQLAARLEKSIRKQAARVVHLNQGNYQSQGLSVESTGSQIKIQLDRELVFKSNQGQVQRPSDLSKLEKLDWQLQGTIRNLNQMLSAQRQESARIVSEARLEAERLKAEREASRKAIKLQEKGYGHGLAR